jgi:DNA-binding NtrC family response regulator
MTGGTILVVDDEEKVRDFLKRIISLEGYVVYEAPDITTARKLLQKEDINVVVSDVKLPDGSGLSLIRTIKVYYPRAEIILLTAHARIHEVVAAMRSGAFDYISKGTDINKLMPMIANAVEKAMTRRLVEELKEVLANWEGNMSQLRQVIERVVGPEDQGQAPDGPLPSLPGEEHKGKPMLVFDLASVEKLHIQRVLNYTRGNKVEAARLLNIGLTTVYRKIEEYGLG